ncbi:DUF3231 family protein [Anaerobacillus sp. MEB173]|uniref:DUF3231 family protein n=1 Tax=Anaerobacillus sp. MEB173 TaxID=3383345 RepID=UPI003F924216
MGILGGNQKEEPLHYGEVNGIWQYVAGVKGMIASYQTFLNHSGDKELKNFIEDKINGAQQQIEEMEIVLKENGIALPPAPPERPMANLESIPVGARFNDPEIAAAIAKNIGTGLTALSTIMGQCTREDIAILCGRFHADNAQFGLRLLRIQKEKGWLVLPPLHLKVPELV